MYIDAHCHLEQATFGAEPGGVDAVVARAHAAGVSHLVVVGSSGVTAGAAEAVALCERHAPLYAAVSVHPHEAHLCTDEAVAVIGAMLTHPKVVALGEIGLDYFYDFAPKETQRAVFTRFLTLGRDADVPVMLHIREPDAHADCLAMLDEIGLPSRGGVVHCFTAGPAEAQAYVARGMYLSIPGIITFKIPKKGNASLEALREAVAGAPLDRLLTETDSPYLAPVPHRGGRNEPAFVVDVAAGIAAVRGLSGAEVGRACRENAARLFGLRI